MTSHDAADLRSVVHQEIARTSAQIASLERAVASIVEAAELTSTDDEHDPEGATIAYERAQALALLRQAREDRRRLDDLRVMLESGERIVCATCGEPIVLERLLALPTARTCVRCAS